MRRTLGSQGGLFTSRTSRTSRFAAGLIALEIVAGSGWSSALEAGSLHVPDSVCKGPALVMLERYFGLWLPERCGSPEGLAFDAKGYPR